MGVCMWVKQKECCIFCVGISRNTRKYPSFSLDNFIFLRACPVIPDVFDVIAPRIKPIAG